MINPAAHLFEARVSIDGMWRARARTRSLELDALMDRISINTTVVAKAIALIRGLKSQLDQAIGSGDSTPLRSLSVSLGEEAHALAQSIAGPHAS